MGLAPQSAAKDASLRRRSGLSPAATSSAPATSGRRRARPTKRGQPARTACDLGVELADLGAESPPARREDAKRPLGRGGDLAAAGIGP